jgi:predicted acylesterase/phospholipase RssA
MQGQAQEANSAGGTEESPEADLFLVLEGGGARGVAHVAAWRVLENLISKPRESLAASLPEVLGPERFKLTAVAGTSAGAVAAAFIAAGAKSSDLIDSAGRVPLCDVLGVGYFHDLFGARGWERLKFIRWFQRPSRRLADEAARLTPPGQRTLRRSAAVEEETSGQAATTPASPNEGENPFLRFIFAGILFFIVWQLFDAAGLFKSTAFSVNLFLFWLILSYGGTLLFRMVLRALERRKREQRRRHYSNMFRALARPSTPLVVAAAITFMVAILPLFWQGDTPAPSLFTNFVLAPVLYGLGGGLAAVGLVAVLRRGLRGRVRTDLIERDINLALRTLLTHSVARWSDEADCPMWKPKTAGAQQDEVRLTPQSDPPDVSFRELYDATGIELSIIAADTIKNEVCVYSTVSNPDFPVARAVAASLAIPFAFRHIRDGHKILVDGGLVSSIPAWVYRRQRTRDPDCRILAIGIEPEEFDTWIPYFFDERNRIIDGWKVRGRGVVGRQLMTLIGHLVVLRYWPITSLMWPVRFAVNVASTSMFGARALELDASDRLDNFSLRPSLRLLDFDAKPEFLKKELSHLENRARSQILNGLWLRRRAFEDVCADIEDDLRQRGVVGRVPCEKGHIRMFWAERDGVAEAVRIKHTYGFDDKEHFDDRLVFPFGTSMSAWAVETGVSQFAHEDLLKKMLAPHMNRYRRAVRWSQLRWCWAIPVGELEPGKFRGVLAIESNEALGTFDRNLGREGAQRSGRWNDPATGELSTGHILKDIARSSAGGLSHMPERERKWRSWMEEGFLRRRRPPDVVAQASDQRQT